MKHKPLVAPGSYFTENVGEPQFTKRKRYMNFHKEMMEKAHEITKQKNNDYAGVGDDPFANFRICESNNICSTETGFLVRMSDKMARINTFVQSGTLLVKDESVEDTLLDLANYAILMAGYIKDKKGEL